MIYREYRPQKFADVVGNQDIIKSITNSLKSNDFAHAYFFYGGRGTGKTTTARLIAKILNCQNLQYSTDPNNHIYVEPCNVCANCKQVVKNSFIDLIELDAASNRGIDNIKDLIETVKFAPTSGQKKVYIIDEVHMLTNEASNALLKTLEEPPKHVHFILCTTNPEKVLDTIKSRCIQYNFTKPDVDLIKTKLNRIIDDKQIKITNEKLHEIAVSANGAFRDAETLLEQYLYNLNSEENFDLSLSYSTFINLYIKRDLKNLVNLLQYIVSTNTNYDNWIFNLLTYLRDVQLFKIGIFSPNYFSEVDKELSQSIDNDRLLSLITAVTDSTAKINSTPLLTLPLEMALIELLKDDLVDNFDKKIEKKTNTTDIDFSKMVRNHNKSDHSGNASSTDSDINSSELSKAMDNITVKQESTSLDEDYLSTTEMDITVAKKGRGRKKTDESTNINVVDEIPVDENILNDNFPYQKMLDILKDKHHSVFLTLKSCKFGDFSNNTLTIISKFSYHKDRLSTLKNQKILEDLALELTNTNIKFICEVTSKEKFDLTDHNIVTPKKDINEIFSDVFGQEIKEEDK